MKVVWTKTAQLHWDLMVDYVLKEFGASVAANLLKEGIKWQQQLAKYPHLGHQEPLLGHRSNTYYSLVIHKQSKVIYYFTEDTIYIADVWDTRREPKSLTKQVH